jgi:hypothetical protein
MIRPVYCHAQGMQRQPSSAAPVRLSSSRLTCLGRSLHKYGRTADVKLPGGPGLGGDAAGDLPQRHRLVLARPLADGQGDRGVGQVVFMLAAAVIGAGDGGERVGGQVGGRARLTPMSRAMEAMVASGWASSTRACLICPAVMAGGRPRRWPRARAAARALERALDDELADGPGQGGEHVEHQPPAGVVVSRASFSDQNPTPRLRRPATTEIRSCSDRPGRPGDGDDQGVAWPQEVQGLP